MRFLVTSSESQVYWRDCDKSIGLFGATGAKIPGFSGGGVTQETEGEIFMFYIGLLQILLVLLTEYRYRSAS